MSDEDSKSATASRAQRRMSERDRNRYLKRQYGIDLSTYDAILAVQNNGCAICGNGDAKSVDVDQKTGQIRGVLCRTCHVAVIPAVERYSHLLEAAKKYLEAPVRNSVPRPLSEETK